MKSPIVFLFFICSSFICYSQNGTFVTRDGNGVSIVTMTPSGCTAKSLVFCNIFNAGSIGMDGNILYFNDYYGSLYKSTITSDSVINCQPVGQFTISGMDVEYAINGLR